MVDFLVKTKLSNFFPGKPEEVPQFCLPVLKGLGLIYFLNANGVVLEFSYSVLFDARL